VIADRADLRRALGWSLVAGLSIAALTAAVAVVDGSFGDTDWKVIGTSLGFAIFSALGASGASLRLRRADPRLQSLGAATAGLAVLAFALLVLALWGDSDGDAVWQWWGTAALLSLGSSHASLVLAARKRTDSAIVDALVRVSLATGLVDTSIAILILVEAVTSGPAEILSLLVIALVLSTALTPILRRLTVAPGASGPTSSGSGDMATELLEIAARVERLAQAAGPRSGDLRRYADGLRASAKRLS
jgi:hypothetical protein